MTDEEFADYLALSYERTGVEFKSPGTMTHPLLAKVIRAMMGMANRSGGGLVIIGVEEADGKLNPIGLAADQLSTWQYDDLADQVARYTDPPAQFEIEVHQYGENDFVVCVVKEFDEIPILCKKSFGDTKNTVLRDGACYVRGVRKRETVEAPSHVEMRELLERASQRLMERFIARSRALGISVFQDTVLEDEKLFAHERDGWTGQVLSEIHSRGYWDCSIHPGKYLEARIKQLPTLVDLLERNAVRDRGWDYPHTESPGNLHFDTHWIGREGTYEHILEAWRFSQSGQFIHVAGFDDDWLDRLNPMWMKTPPNWKPGMQISVESVVYRCTEVFRLASRLAADERYQADRQLHISIRLAGIKDRRLYYERPSFFSSRQLPHADIPEYTHSVDIPLEELIAQPNELAIQAAQEIFHRFHWEPSQAALSNTQARMDK